MELSNYKASKMPEVCSSIPMGIQEDTMSIVCNQNTATISQIRVLVMEIRATLIGSSPNKSAIETPNCMFDEIIMQRAVLADIADDLRHALDLLG